MTKRNSNFSIYAHLRMILKAFPMRNEASLRLAIAARIEADEGTGEIFGRGDVSPRHHLQDVANVPRENSLDEAMSQIGKLKLIQNQRIYSRGRRQRGGDTLVLNWDQWEEACLPLSAGQAQKSSTPLSGGQPPALSGGQPPALSGGQYNKDNGYSNDDSNVDGHTNGVPATLSISRMVPASDSLNFESGVGAELQMQEPEVVEPREGIPWVEASAIPPTYAQAVWFDRTIGKLFLVRGPRGSAFYQSLRNEPQYTPEIIARAISNAGARAPATKARNGGLEALVRTYCGYALEKQTAAGGAARARETAFQRPRAFQP